MTLPKKKSGLELSVQPEIVERKIFIIRGEKVMLDRDLAALYGVETRALVQAVKRNYERFPGDFMFQLSGSELSAWRSHFVMSNPKARKGLRRRPYAFTEQGIAMLSSVLRSKRAIQVNVAIMRVFVHLRAILASNRELAKRVDEHDAKIKQIFDLLRHLLNPTDKPPPIGFRKK